MGDRGGLELQVPVQPSICIPQIRAIPIIRETWGATAVSGGTAVAKGNHMEEVDLREWKEQVVVH